MHKRELIVNLAGVCLMRGGNLLVPATLTNAAVYENIIEQTPALETEIFLKPLERVVLRRALCLWCTKQK
jgi:hypothetical protein